MADGRALPAWPGIIAAIAHEFKAACAGARCGLAGFLLKTAARRQSLAGGGRHTPWPGSNVESPT